MIAREELIPVRTPDDLEDVPSGTAEHGLQLVDDARVAAHRAVQPLQVAVDDEDQVVELLACAQRDRAQRVYLIRLAITDERPHLAIGVRNQAAVLQILHEARLVDRVQRTDAHRNCGELPEVLHQPGMRIGAQAGLIAQLMAEVLQAASVETSLEKRAPVNSRRGVSLEVDEVARLLALLARVGSAEEMVEAHLQQRGLRGIRGDVTTDARIVLVLLVHHRHRIPANQRLDAALQFAVAGVRHLIVLGNSVQEGSDDVAGRGYTCFARAGTQRRQQHSALFPILCDDLVKGLDPLGDLRGHILLDGSFKICRQICRHPTLHYAHL